MQSDKGAFPMSDNPQPQPVDAATLKYLRLLVSVLTATMVIGFVIIVVLFVIRFSDAFSAKLPDTIELPDGTTATAFTKGADWYAIVTADNRILIYDLDTGALKQTITLD